MKPSAFCYMLKGFLQGKTALNSEDTKHLKAELNSVFEHHIDKQYPEDDGLSQAIHDGKKFPDDDEEDDDDSPVIKKKKRPQHPLGETLVRC